MRNVQVYVELSDMDYSLYEDEATRCGVTVEALVQKMVQGLVRDMQREEQEGTDHPILG